jgi:hypothetical protein
MVRLSGHRIGVAQGESILFSDFEGGGPMWDGEGRREARHAVAFEEPFLAPPAVQVGLAMWDISSAANARVDLHAEAVTPEGFEIVFRTWGDTRIARVRATWIAIGAVRDDEDWDVG